MDSNFDFLPYELVDLLASCNDPNLVTANQDPSHPISSLATDALFSQQSQGHTETITTDLSPQFSISPIPSHREEYPCNPESPAVASSPAACSSYIPQFSPIVPILQTFSCIPSQREAYPCNPELPGIASSSATRSSYVPQFSPMVPIMPTFSCIPSQREAYPCNPESPDVASSPATCSSYIPQSIPRRTRSAINPKSSLTPSPRPKITATKPEKKWDWVSETGSGRSAKKKREIKIDIHTEASLKDYFKKDYLNKPKRTKSQPIHKSSLGDDPEDDQPKPSSK